MRASSILTLVGVFVVFFVVFLSTQESLDPTRVARDADAVAIATFLENEDVFSSPGSAVRLEYVNYSDRASDSDTRSNACADIGAPGSSVCTRLVWFTHIASEGADASNIHVFGFSTSTAARVAFDSLDSSFETELGDEVPISEAVTGPIGSETDRFRAYRSDSDPDAYAYLSRIGPIVTIVEHRSVADEKPTGFYLTSAPETASYYLSRIGYVRIVEAFDEGSEVSGFDGVDETVQTTLASQVRLSDSLSERMSRLSARFTPASERAERDSPFVSRTRGMLDSFLAANSGLYNNTPYDPKLPSKTFVLNASATRGTCSLEYGFPELSAGHASRLCGLSETHAAAVVLTAPGDYSLDTRSVFSSYEDRPERFVYAFEASDDEQATAFAEGLMDVLEAYESYPHSEIRRGIRNISERFPVRESVDAYHHVAWNSTLGHYRNTLVLVDGSYVFIARSALDEQGRTYDLRGVTQDPERIRARIER